MSRVLLESMVVGPKPIVPYSYSKLNTYNDCPRKFQLKYLLKADIGIEEMPPALSKGKYLHKLIELHIKNLVRGPVTVDREYIVNLGEMAKGELHPHINLKDELDDLFIKIVNSPKFIELLGSIKTIEVEKRLQYPPEVDGVIDKESIVLIGYVDALITTNTGEIVILDWKSGKTKNYTGSQLAVYYLLLQGYMNDLDEVTIRYFMLEQDEDIVLKIKRDDKILNETIEFINNTVNSITSDTNFVADTRNCTFCDYAKVCDNVITAMLEASKLGKILNFKVEDMLTYMGVDYSVYDKDSNTWVKMSKDNSD